MRFKTLANFALASAAALLLSGCADDSPRQLYYWDGAYTGSVYEYLSEEGDAGAQIAALEESLQKAYQRAAKVPPGLFLLNQNSKSEANLNTKDANLGSQSQEKAGASEPNLSDKGSNLEKQISKQNLKNKQTKSAKASKTAKGSQNEK